MQIKKCPLLTALLVCLINILPAEEFHTAVELEQDKNIIFYAGINPVALMAFLPNPIGLNLTIGGLLSGQEYGISLYSGMYFTNAHSVKCVFLLDLQIMQYGIHKYN